MHPIQSKNDQEKHPKSAYFLNFNLGQMCTYIKINFIFKFYINLVIIVKIKNFFLICAIYCLKLWIVLFIYRTVFGILNIF